MAVTGYWFTHQIAQAYGETDGAVTAKLNWVADSASMKCALMHSTYTPAQTGQDFWNDVSAYDVDTVTDVTGYTAGGKTIGTTTMTTTGGSGKVVKFAAGATTVWTTATLTARYAVLYKDTTTASSSPVFAYLDFGTDVPAVAGDFTITWHTDGIATITVS